MKANYVQIAFRLMTLGKTLYNPAYGTPPFPYRFHLLIPGRYSLVAESGGAPGTLNGTVPSGVKLPAGDYDFVPAPREPGGSRWSGHRRWSGVTRPSRRSSPTM